MAVYLGELSENPGPELNRGWLARTEEIGCIIGKAIEQLESIVGSPLPADQEMYKTSEHKAEELTYQLAELRDMSYRLAGLITRLEELF